MCNAFLFLYLAVNCFTLLAVNEHIETLARTVHKNTSVVISIA